MHRIGRLLTALLVCLLAAAPPAGAQGGEPGPRVGVVSRDTGLYFTRDASRAPIRDLKSGDRVRILRREGRWYHIVFADSRFGDEIGYAPAPNIREVAAPASVVQAGGEGRDARWGQRGFVELRGLAFPQRAVNDSTRLIADALWRQEVQFKPAGWLQFAAGVDLRANSYQQVEDAWRIDVDDRRTERPRMSLRRLTASLNRGPFSLDLGRQLVRWGKADILNPTDRFAPKDFVNVLDPQFLPVWAVRAAVQHGEEAFEAVYVPRFTPSRLPLLTQRWTVLPGDTAGLPLVDLGADYPERSQQGIRWNHVGSRFETSLSVFDGFNHLADLQGSLSPEGIVISRLFPRLRTYGADVAIPTRFATIKGETAVFRSPDGRADEYVLYVIELERQSGEWLFDGGYAGEQVTTVRDQVAFAAERGLARSFIGRAAYTIGPRRSIAVEGVVRRDGDGAYVKGEYSEAVGGHWRVILSGAALAGQEPDYIGQFRRNGHLNVLLRFNY